MNARVGLGFDIHPFTAGRPLVLGGVVIEGAAGLAGHSDADVVAHAVADAVLGAAGLPDLGTLFPATDDEHVLPPGRAPRRRGAGLRSRLAHAVPSDQFAVASSSSGTS